MKPGLLTYSFINWPWTLTCADLPMVFNIFTLDKGPDLVSHPIDDYFEQQFCTFSIEGWNLPVTTHEV